ncbi:unnamed protein product [Kluyveromyces dobzhanskii CBS 2104]|uniref:WGS project CCBQ000000000 data, contig 00099 n=1 Tax=Kluyveromyces dobzhanskii CBS 2104 TaxID=1427455 RepID=A0A0A8L535_9SACH|nr:unnamed protein product [Kluyveromyces dobzhanskii CBS 2104]
MLGTRLFSTGRNLFYAGPNAATARSLRRSRQLKRPATIESSLVTRIRPATAITTAESYDLQKTIDLLSGKGYRPTTLIPNEIISFKYFHDGSRGDIMVLAQNGSIVSWGFDEKMMRDEILPLVSEARVNSLLDAQYESEDLDYVEVESEDDMNHLKRNYAIGEESCVENELIVINGVDHERALLDKAAFASGISRSTRLAVLEVALDSHIEKTRVFTESLSRGKKLNISEKAVLQSTGRLFLMRGKLNLYSELIETPDLYWSEPQLEKLYRQISRNLDIQPRISILNTKLDYATDEARALMAVLNEKKGTRLEWIIIYLITVEVCFELYHFYEKYENMVEAKHKDAALNK